MVHRNYCLCFLAVLPSVCDATVLSTPHSSIVHAGRQAHLKRSEEHGAYPKKRSYDPQRHGYHGWHYSSLPGVHTSKFTNSEGSGPGMMPEEKKEDEQRDSMPAHSGVVSLISQQSDGLGSPTAAPSLATVLASANTPVSSAISIDSTSAISSSSQSQSQSDGQATQSQHALTALATASSSSPSSALSPALLAFILVPVCVFLLGMAFALYRIYGRPGNRVPRASPMFLGDSTALGSGFHKDEAIAIAMNDPTEDSSLGHHVDKRESIKWEPRVERNPSKSSSHTITGNIRDPSASHGLMPPFRTQTTGNYHTSPSRVLRPHVSRPYNRPHPAFTTDPESVIPLIVNSNKNRIYNNGQDGYTKSNSKGKGKGKENVFGGQSHHARKHRADISTTPLNTSPRTLPFKDPVISAVFSDMDLRLQARSQQRSPTSSVSMTKDKNQLEVPSQSSTLKSSSFDIGVAMLNGFSSPNVGLGLDLSPCPPALTHNLTKRLSHTSEDLATGESINRRSALPYLDDSSTVGSKGLAYLSGSPRETILTDNLSEIVPVQDELDIASALAVYRVQHAGDRQKDQKAPVDQMLGTQRGGNEHSSGDSLASFPSSEARYAPSDIKAPTLPTLSEMALSRADPLYESVTNELFSTYGMRMSTVNGIEQKSRVSARISRMLSWFAGADAGNAGSRISGVENSMSREDSSFSGEGHGVRMSNMSSPGGVQPLRIGKASKNAV